jgi:hypothetical protein
MDIPVLLAVLQSGTIPLEAIVDSIEHKNQRKQKTDHRTLPRSQRRLFKHDEALNAIQRDYLGKIEDPTTPLFGKEFHWMFRISRGRFQQRRRTTNRDWSCRCPDISAAIGEQS